MWSHKIQLVKRRTPNLITLKSLVKSENAIIAINGTFGQVISKTIANRETGVPKATWRIPSQFLS